VKFPYFADTTERGDRWRNFLTLWIPLKEGIGGEGRAQRHDKDRVTLRITLIYTIL